MRFTKILRSPSTLSAVRSAPRFLHAERQHEHPLFFIMFLHLRFRTIYCSHISYWNIHYIYIYCKRYAVGGATKCATLHGMER